MERHPVPQNLMDVEFKLFGALTIRQFGYLAAGCLIGVMFYFSGLPEILRLICIAISVGGGLFLSLVKINGQSSTIWLSNFILSMLVPQERLWRKSPIVPEVLKEDPTLKLSTDKDLIKILSSHSKYGSLPKNPLADLEKEETPVDIEEKKELEKIEGHFDFLFESLPQIEESSNAVTRPGTYSRKDEIIEKLESPIINTPKSIAQAVSGFDTNKSVVYRTDSFTTVVKPIKTDVNRPITITKIPSTTELEKKSNLVNNVNYIKGLILDKEQKVLSGVKVNILDSKSRLIKTFISDGSGMVISTSPLDSGDYYIDCVAKGYDFGRFMLSLNGQKQYLIKIIAK